MTAKIRIYLIHINLDITKTYWVQCNVKLNKVWRRCNYCRQLDFYSGDSRLLTTRELKVLVESEKACNACLRPVGDDLQGNVFQQV